jgi:putative ABC transport system permease protein
VSARDRGQPLWRRYLRFRGPDVAADVNDEIGFHLDMLTDELVAAGMPRDVARRRAAERFGDRAQVERECRTIGEKRQRAIRRTEWLDALLTDLTFALRQIRANRMLSAVSVITLALGIGATTAIFSVVHSVLLRPLPYADADRMHVVWSSWRGSNGFVSAGHYADWKARNRSFERLAAFEWSSFNVAPAGAEPERVAGARVTPNFFRVARMQPALGRWLAEGEDSPGRDHVVVLSYPLWRRLGADASIIGKPLTLNSEPHTVVGVMPEAFTLTAQDEALWVPRWFTAEERVEYDAFGLFVFGTLRPGVTRAQAVEEFERLNDAVTAEHPELPLLRERGATLEPFRDVLIGSYDTQLIVLLASVGLVLLLAVVNVANLLLARSRARQKEISIRAALGAGRGRIIRQLLTESVLLSLAGGVAGLVIAWLGIRFLVSMGPAALPRLDQAQLSLPVLGFCFAVAVGAGLLFGLAPALRVARVDLQTTLREGGRTGGLGSARDRLRGVLVVGELALALVLLVGAGLLIRTSIQLARVPAGFDAEGLLTARLSLPSSTYPAGPAVVEAYGRMVDELRQRPGVERAAAINSLPMGSASTDVGLRVEGRTFGEGESPQVHYRIVTPGYLETMRIPLRAGRVIGEHDGVGAPQVVVINQALARRLWPGESPLGKRVACCTGDDVVWREIVGVVGDVHHWGPRVEPAPEMYLPFRQAPAETWDWFDRSMTLVVRADRPESQAAAMRGVVRSVDPTLPISDLRTMREVVARTRATTRFNTLLLTALALTGLALALVGIYGVISFFVSQRTQEIGIRLALGATTGDVLRMVVREGLVIGSVGLCIGLAVALLATRVLRALLFEVTSTDPLTLAASTLLMLGAAVLASWIPARSAARVEPIVSLR